MISRVVELSSLALGADSGIEREKPRPHPLRQADYDLKFDNSTLFYDVFQDRDRVRLAGPPLLNLKNFVNDLKFSSNGSQPIETSFEDLDRTQHSWLLFEGACDSIQIEGDLVSESISVGESFSSQFEGRRALITKSKNNELVWIRDWVTFHVENQGIDSVIIYDNNSDQYSPQDILDTLEGIRGLEVAIVVVWPFKFGPQGGNWGGVKNAPWDSDFTEYGILEHARYRFLQDAALVISADVDELVMSDDGRPVAEIIASQGVPGLVYTGTWITTVKDDSETSGETVSFKNFIYYDKNSKPTTQKWAIRASQCKSASQWKTHSIPGVKLARTSEVRHRHFVGISSNWKTQRTNNTIFDSDKHVIDAALVNAQVISGIKAGEVLNTQGHPGPESLDSQRSQAFEFIKNNAEKADIPFPLDYSGEGDGPLCLKTHLEGHSLEVVISLNDDGFLIQMRGSNPRSHAWLSRIWGRESRQSESELDFITIGGGARSSREGSLIWELFVSKVSWMINRSKALSYPSVSEAEVSSPASLPTYWWTGRTNFGDLIGPLLVSELSGRPVHNMKDTGEVGQCLVTVGSVLNLLERPGTDIWGSGLIAPLHEKSIRHLREHKPSRIHAVRGWRTYKELTQKLGWEVPRIFGDPALLLPRVYSPKDFSSFDSVIIPHYQHAKYFEKFSDEFNVLNVERSAEEVVSEIANAQSVVSTSLHGLIVAQAYGVPWTWLRLNDVTLAGDQFKFEDFFTVLDRSKVSETFLSSSELSSSSLRSSFRAASLPQSKFDFNNLMDAFPRDFAM